MNQVVGVCTIVIALGAVSGCIATKQSYVAKGNKLYAAGKYEDAALNYRKAIQKDPKFGEAYYRLGLSAVKQNNVREAYEALFRAVQLLPDNIDAKEKFADVCLAIYLADPDQPKMLYGQITQLSKELLEHNANSYEGLILQGYLASSDRKPEQAIALFRKALQIDSSNAGVTTQLVRLLIQNGQVSEAEKVARDLIARQRTYGLVYDMLYDFYSKSDRMADAENILRTKVQNNPKEADYIVQLARHYYRHQKIQEMNATLQELVADAKDFPLARLWVGDFYVGLQNFPDALRYYQEGLSNSREEKDKLVYRKRMAISLVALKRKDEALRMVEEVVKASPKDEEALHLHADLLLDTSKPENADSALKEFKILSDKNPDDASLRLQMGRAYRLKGDLAEAKDQLQAALKMRPNLVEARYELAEIGLSQARPEDALQQTTEILKVRPDDNRARLLNARALKDTGNLGSARAELTRLIKDSPQYTPAQLQLGMLDVVERKPQDAIDIFNKLRSSEDPNAYAGLATAYTAQRQLDKAREAVNEGLKKWPDSPILLEQLASLQAAGGNLDGAIAQYRQLLARDPNSVELRRRMGDIYELRADHANAITLFQQANELAPRDIDIALTLADILVRAGRNAEAKKKYEGILGAHPENPGALNNLAFLLADTGGDLDEALRLAQRALAKVPNQPAFSDTVGYVYLKKGLSDSAVQTFGTLVRKYPHFAPFRYHLGMALLEKGDRVAAKKELQAALDDRPSMQDKKKITELLTKIG